MAEENKNLPVENNEATEGKKKSKPVEKKPNFFVRFTKKAGKFLKDVRGEMGKVVWLSKGETLKSTKIVLVTVIAVGVAIAVVDTAFSYLINTIAGWIG